MSARMETRVRLLNAQQQNVTTKVEFKGPVTKWEKRWVTVGHLKLLRWTPIIRSKKVSVTVPAQNSVSTPTHHQHNTGTERQKLRPFNDNAPITRSVTSTHKNIKDALITTLETKRHGLKGTKRGQSNVTNAILNSDSNSEEPIRKELKTDSSPPPMSLPTLPSPTQPIIPEDSISSPVTPTSDFAPSKRILDEQSQDSQDSQESQESQESQSQSQSQSQEQILPPLSSTQENTTLIETQEKSENESNENNENSENNENENDEDDSDSEESDDEEGDDDQSE